MEKELNSKRIESTTAKSQLQGAIGLEEAGKEAEILAMEKTIESINEHAREYLETLFKDPIVVRLESYKTTTKNTKKAQINTIVEYQGDRYNSVNELSGGEGQRCELAFILAVNDMIGSNVLLLDECLNNLDAEINTEVLSYLHKLSCNKLILVVSHEAIRGVFDEIVEIV